MDHQEEEVNLPEVAEPKDPTPEIDASPSTRFLKPKRSSVRAFISILLAFALGLSSGYFAWGRPTAPAETALKPSVTPTAEHEHPVTIDMAAIAQQVNPPEGYTLPVKLGDLGSQLVAAGAIDYQKFVKVYADAGQPLTDEQIAILTEDRNQPIAIKSDNAYFLLNFFWAVGLTNQNTILTTGPMMTPSGPPSQSGGYAQNGQENIGNFASTGGWTIGSRSPIELYASTALFTFSAEQQRRLEEVAQNVFRPCCDNPTHFPDCNHGMAMLGLLELMASQNATVDERFTAAKHVNAFWYPQQSLEQAVAFKAAKGLDYSEVDARELTSAKFSSGTGFKGMHQWLANNGLLQQGPGGGNNCGV